MSHVLNASTSEDWKHETESWVYIYLNKAAASQIFLVDSIIFLFSNYGRKIINILIYSTKYSEIMPWTMEQKMFSRKTYYETKSFKTIQAIYRKKVNFNKFL